MVEASRTYQIGLAQLTQVGLFRDEMYRAIERSWRSGASVTRYGRRWYLSNHHLFLSGVVTGRIGFLTDASVQSVFFDRESGEFVADAVTSGVIVPFAIRLSDGVITYQLRPGLVRENSFTGALEGLLNAPGSEYVWEVRAAVEERSWEAWRDDATRINSFAIKVERPNPHYGDDRLIEEAVEGVNVEYLRLAGKADEDGSGVDPNADLFRQAVNHVLRGYGRATVQGLDGQGDESTWVKAKGVAGSVTRRIRRPGFGEPEVDDRVLVETLVGLAAHRVSVSADVSGLDDDLDET